MKTKKKKRKKRKGRGMRKGSPFERFICKKLSLWWTGDERDDVFWRTSGSGARAKARNKTGKSTFGQCGDVQATDPIGQPLIDLCTIEIKRGYNKAIINDFIDSKKKPELRVFIEQAITDCTIRDDDSEWILLVKRDRKDTVLFTSLYFTKCWPLPVNKLLPKFPVIRMRVKIKRRWINVVAMRFDDFLLHVTPKMIKKVWKWKRRRK
jgi:hypothetical protein